MHTGRIKIKGDKQHILGGGSGGCRGEENWECAQEEEEEGYVWKTEEGWEKGVGSKEGAYMFSN